MKLKNVIENSYLETIIACLKAPSKSCKIKNMALFQKQKYNITVNLIATFFILFMFSCKKQKKEVVEKQIDKTEKIEISKDSVLEVHKDTLANKKVQKENNIDKKFLLNHYESFYVDNETLDFLIPVFLKNPTFPYLPSQYPEKLEFAKIPNKRDTLQVIKGESSCYNCPSFIAIYQNEKLLYYNYKRQETILVEYGSLTKILKKRALDKIALLHLDVLSELELSSTTYFNEFLDPKYITSSNLNLASPPDIYLLKKQIDSSMQINSLDALAKYYKKELTRPNNLLYIDNFISNKDAYSYNHLGVIAKKINANVLLFIDSINIFYINPNNDIYKVTWMSNYSEYFLKNQVLLDDNTINLVAGKYEITDWKSDKKINLFNPKMSSGKYLAVYQLKLKDDNTYIYSDIKTIYYNKSKETEQFTSAQIEEIEQQELAKQRAQSELGSDEPEEQENEEYLGENKTPYIAASAIKLAKSPDIYLLKKQFDNKILGKNISIDTLASFYNDKLTIPNVIKIDNLLSNENAVKYQHSGAITTNLSIDVMLSIETLNIYYINARNDIYKVKWLSDYLANVTTDEEPLDDNTIDLVAGKYEITDWKSNKKINLFNPAMTSGTYLVIYQLKIKGSNTYIYSKINKIHYTQP